MIAVLRRARRLRRADEGVTLVELIVYMALASVVLIVLGSMFVSVSKNTYSSLNQRTSTAEAQNMMDLMASDIRSATNVPVSSTTTSWASIAATPTSYTFITYTDAGPTFGVPYQVQLTTDAQGRLVLSQWNPPAAATVGTFPRTDTPSLTRYVGMYVTNSSMFTYLDSNGTNLDPTGVGVTAANLPKVAAVQVSLTVRAGSSTTAVTITNTVWMPNAGLTTSYAGAN